MDTGLSPTAWQPSYAILSYPPDVTLSYTRLIEPSDETFLSTLCWRERKISGDQGLAHDIILSREQRSMPIFCLLFVRAATVITERSGISFSIFETKPSLLSPLKCILCLAWYGSNDKVSQKFEG